MHIFEFRRPLPDDCQQLYVIAGASDAKERKAVDAVVALKFHRGADGLLHNDLCDEELGRIQAKVAQTSQAGARGALKRWGNERHSERHTDAIAGGIANRCNEVMKELTNERNEETSRTSISVPPGDLKKTKSPAPPKGISKVGADSSLEQCLLSSPDERPSAQLPAKPPPPRSRQAPNLPPQTHYERAKAEGTLFIRDDDLFTQ
jgi:uncharacterized protein YdaU (DUF1376 family)